jgi:hypothetical protein
MNLFKNVSLVVAGCAIGIVLVIACGNDSPGAADAAVCDCAESEAPVPERLMIVEEVVQLEAMGLGGGGVGCPNDAPVITGSCDVDIPNSGTVLLASGFAKSSTQWSWSCTWSNTTANTFTGTIRAVCLMPAE